MPSAKEFTGNYITCHAKKASPRVSPMVCRRCKRVRDCRDYWRFVQPALFPETQDRPLRPSPRKRLASTALSESAQAQTPHQLTFDFE